MSSPVSLPISCTIILLLCIGCIQTQSEDSPIETRNVQTINFNNRLIYIYKNIPYARSPRFQLPEPLAEASSGNSDGNCSCPQVSYPPGDLENGTAIGGEDCLFLDVYSTQVPENQNWPVLIYFHGGSFSRGSKDDYAPLYLMKEQDFIVVIPNYRLGIFGFLCTQDPESNCNIGLFDQRMALKWVNENIWKFGGNKSHVTIGGHGAGAVSVHLHILANESQGYFSSAIAGSGTALDPWAISKNSRDNVEYFAKNLSCPTSTSRAMVQCLKGKSLEDLQQTQINLPNITFGPAVDGRFLLETPKILYTKLKQSVPLLAGVTKDESSIEFYSKYAEATKVKNIDSMLTYLLYPYLKNNNNPNIVIKAAKYHYLRGITGPNLEVYDQLIIQLMTDFLYNSGLEMTLKNLNALNENMWMYVFEYETSPNLGDIFGPAEHSGEYGVSHMEDVMYLFNVTYASWMWKNTAPRTEKIRTRLGKMWRDFITGQNSSPRWNVSLSEKSYIPVNERNDFSKPNYRQSECDFWNSLVPDIQTVDSSGTVEHQVKTKEDSAKWGLTGVVILLAVLCVALAGVVVVMRKQFARKCNVSNTSKTHDTKDSGV